MVTDPFNVLAGTDMYTGTRVVVQYVLYQAALVILYSRYYMCINVPIQ